MRDFETWLKSFRGSIASYDYYIEFKKVYKNAEELKIPLNILNSLIGSCNIKTDFEKLLMEYPIIKKAIPILIAKRELEIYCQDENGGLLYDFHPNSESELTVAEYSYFMEQTGLFDLLQKHIINNLMDYVVGVEVGLDSNGRKNRGGHLMEDLVESFIVKAGFIKNVTYFKEMYIHEIEEKWGMDLAAISNQGKMEKRFDFVVKTDDTIFVIETNFYSSGGSKLNETARSYKTLALEAENIPGLVFVWFTDGQGWNSAKHNLEETFDVMENIYNINDLENQVIQKIIK